MPVQREQLAHHGAHLWVVVDEQDVELLAHPSRRRRVGWPRRLGRDEAERDRRAAILDAVDRQLAAVAADDAVGDAQAEAGAGEPLRREERLHRPLLHARRHAAAGVHHGAKDGSVLRPGGDRDLAAVRQRLDRVEDEVHENLPQR